MVRASIQLITALRKTADAIECSSAYQWGHMGACNCGFLAQEITHLRKDEIHTRAMRGHGDWTEQLTDYCATSGLPMDDIITDILSFGFDSDDLKHLERLSDARILQSLPVNERILRHNNKADVIKYMHAWADLLESELLRKIELPDLSIPHFIL